jgi:hypothetical protein
MAHGPDIFLAGQLAPALPGSKPFQGERRLMLAVLGDAVDCYRRGRRARDPATRLLFDETRAWLESTDRRALFSFESICDALDIDADYLRRGLRQRQAPGWAHGGTASARRRERGGSSLVSHQSPGAESHAAATGTEGV